MTLDDLLLALAANHTRVLLDQSGSFLWVRGARPPDNLKAEIKMHRAAIISGLQEARSTAKDLYRDGEADAFERELLEARDAGRLTVTDWCGGLLAISLARPRIEKRTLALEGGPSARSPGLQSQAPSIPNANISDNRCIRKGR